MCKTKAQEINTSDIFSDLYFQYETYNNNFVYIVLIFLFAMILNLKLEGHHVTFKNVFISQTVIFRIFLPKKY